ncbi:MAG: dihydrodipicolinate synthase family protein [Verrucomicrobia bacterium]|nr:dihydrodipicolinate synthase family protein [Verrucomicrobiota bacterium]
MNATDIPRARRQWLARLFPAGIPTLWCPVITHYRADGGLDRARQAAHLRHLAPFVKGFLIPGSTGDGWEMDNAEIRELLDFALAEAARLDLHVLIGVLKTDAAQARVSILDTVNWLKTRAGTSDVDAALAASRVCGFTVCPPKGSELNQQQIHDALASILELGLPIALYQLPQVTLNEMSPETVATLAARFANFVLFKDTSGADRVALNGCDLGGVFLVRGAEADYARWPRGAGGPYDGFLLSTANCFARELHGILDDVAKNQPAKAQSTAANLTSAVNEIFRVVTGLPHGNAFANANKAADHFFAHGSKALSAPPPRLHAGSSLPMQALRATGEVLSRHGLLPERGYLE